MRGGARGHLPRCERGVRARRVPLAGVRTDSRLPLRVIHLTGAADEGRVRAAYTKAGVPAVTNRFEVDAGLRRGGYL